MVVNTILMINMTEKRFWCLEEYKGETSPIVDGKFAPTNGWLCNRLNELYEENGQLKQAYQTLKHRHSLLHDECLETECDRNSLKKDVISLEKENENLNNVLEDFMVMLNRLQAEPDNKSLQIMAKDMLRMMGKDIIGDMND